MGDPPPTARKNQPTYCTDHPPTTHLPPTDQPTTTAVQQCSGTYAVVNRDFMSKLVRIALILKLVRGSSCGLQATFTFVYTRNTTGVSYSYSSAVIRTWYGSRVVKPGFLYYIAIMAINNCSSQKLCREVLLVLNRPPTARKNSPMYETIHQPARHHLVHPPPTHPPPTDQATKIAQQCSAAVCTAVYR